MIIDVKALVPFLMGAFFSLLLAARYGSLLLGVAFFMGVTVVCLVLNRFLRSRNRSSAQQQPQR